MIEKERKFILKYMPEVNSAIDIKQAYMMTDGRKNLRVRIIDGRYAKMTFKVMLSDVVRQEYEYDIPVSDAIEMYEQSDMRLHKTRHVTSFDGNHVDIDVYDDGVSIVEIEYENELSNIPDYCGREVTGVMEYSNIFIAKNNKP